MPDEVVKIVERAPEREACLFRSAALALLTAGIVLIDGVSATVVVVVVVGLEEPEEPEEMHI